MGDVDEWAWNGWAWVDPAEMTDGQLADYLAEKSLQQTRGCPHLAATDISRRNVT
jgi:hypothetical protein